LKFIALPLKGAYQILPEYMEDERGFFARSFCAKEFGENGLNPKLEQCNISYNKKMGTLRGMHYQVGEKSEAKLVRCTRGIIYDVIIDLRPHSETFKKWIGIEISDTNHHMIYIPEGFAHGFQTLKDNTEVFYQMSAYFSPHDAKGIRWNDISFGIKWPCEQPSIISIKDQQYSDFIS
jgi:dTDP-4-dehydrorhamnose 3,5-epimerase